MRGIITVASGKGGSGKTTSALTIAGALRTLGALPDALIDLDYGASATRAYGYEPSSPLSEALLDCRIDFSEAVNETEEGVPLIPATTSLATVPKERMVQWRDRLRQLGASRLLVIDTSDDILSAPVAAAILAADILAIPVPLSKKAYDRTFPEIAGLLDSFKHAPEAIWFATMADPRTAIAKHVLKLLADDGIELAGIIPKGVAIEEADFKGASVIRTDPQSKPALAYLDLARTIYARLRRINGETTAMKRRQPHILEPLTVEA